MIVSTYDSELQSALRCIQDNTLSPLAPSLAGEGLDYEHEIDYDQQKYSETAATLATLQERHEERRVWISITSELRDTYTDEDGNMQFKGYLLDEKWCYWKNKFCETYVDKGWSPIRQGTLHEYALKKERLLLEL
ncbi:hypothetical protein HW555_013826 [Spodoptera exigua]|uniref:Uncharacterized protein n=1 Tax=Spodoptera exigua TaxID=7107 RepID=A0A835G2P0_SPOEX|nr:hypothetical protein HW555_013826 [Spodoptera exigua]